MRTYLGLLCIGILALYSCELQEEKISTSSSTNLFFSTDTVLFDTLLTEKTSLTKRFRIFNPSKNAVSISSIRLGNGDESNYSIIVNGKEASHIEDELLFGGDSLLVLVNVYIDPQDVSLPYLVKDSVIVEWNAKRTHVKLVAWGQDAIYLNSEVICDQIWTADRPYVIYNYAIIDSLCTLTMQPGTRVFLENGSSLLVGGTLKILGDSGNRVTLRNTRFDANYQEAPGQWSGIVFGRYSEGNEIRYATIENAETAIYIGHPDEDEVEDLIVSNTIIRHMLNYGVFSVTSDIYMYNTLIYDCGSAMIGNFAGGTYIYEHCTFSNWPSLLQSEDPGVVFWDYLPISNTEAIIGDLSVNLKNSIIWGSKDSELDIQVSNQANVLVELTSNIIRSKQAIPNNTTSVQNNYPGFDFPLNFDFQLDSLANARNAGTPSEITDDLLGRPRDTMPDLGAYERLDK